MPGLIRFAFPASLALLGAGILRPHHPDAAAEALREVLEMDSASAAAWPGFRVRDEVLIVTDRAAGVVAVAGDRAPDPSYVPWPRDPRIRIRRGPVPDSLPGLRLGMTWRGIPGAATVLEHRADAHFAMALVHESFHTYQDRVRSADPRRSLQPYGATDSAALAAAALESRALARAVAAAAPAEAARHARTALAARELRCRVRAEACRQEPELERLEGIPTYVAARTTGNGRYSASALAARLGSAPSRPQLARWYFYDSGMAWLTLLERLGPADWKRRVEVQTPHMVLAAVLRPGHGAARALERSAEHAAALAQAGATLRAERDAAAAAERLFWGQPGVPMRVRWSPGPGAGPISVSHSQSRSAQGVPVLVMHYGRGANHLELTGEHRTIEGATVFFLRRTDAVATVNEARVPLDGPAREHAGAVAIRAPGVSVAFEDARLQVYADSITVHAVVR
jgi:hypothetical protein